MEKRCVLLLCTESLLGEGLEDALSEQGHLELVGPWSPDSGVLDRLSQAEPDVVLVAEGENESWASLVSRLLEQRPDFPIVRIELAQDVMRVHTSRVMPARIANVIEVIQFEERGKGTMEDGGWGSAPGTCLPCLSACGHAQAGRHRQAGA